MPWPHYPNKNAFNDLWNRLYGKSASLRCGGKKATLAFNPAKWHRSFGRKSDDRSCSGSPWTRCVGGKIIFFNLKKIIFKTTFKNSNSNTQVAFLRWQSYSKCHRSGQHLPPHKLMPKSCFTMNAAAMWSRCYQNLQSTQQRQSHLNHIWILNNVDRKIIFKTTTFKISNSV